MKEHREHVDNVPSIVWGMYSSGVKAQRSVYYVKLNGVVVAQFPGGAGQKSQEHAELFVAALADEYRYADIQEA